MFGPLEMQGREIWPRSLKLINILIALHVLAAVIWVGGMFFAIMVLRTAASDLEPPLRLALWSRVFSRFFAWVWAALLILVVSGYWMIFELWNQFAGLPLHVNMMQAIGWIMILIYLYLWFGPFKRFKAALAAEELPVAAGNLNKIRLIVMTNLALGLITVVIAASGRFW